MSLYCLLLLLYGSLLYEMISGYSYSTEVCLGTESLQNTPFQTSIASANTYTLKTHSEGSTGCELAFV